MSLFDQIVDRRGIGALALASERFSKAPNLIPMWVADMAFEAPPPVKAALAERVDRGVFGYSVPPEGYELAVCDWMRRRHGWEVDPAWITPVTGVVPSLHLAVWALTSVGDGVVVQNPSYPPMRQAVESNGRRLLVNPLVLVGDQYQIDFDHLEACLSQAKLFLLCSPHNPVGRVWARDELERMGEACLRHGVIIVADEIHHDLFFPPAKHLVLASLDAELAHVTVTCAAPSKTFSLAGLQQSNLVISNPDLRAAMARAYAAAGQSQCSALGLWACRAAYLHGDAWLDELLGYLAGNLELFAQAVAGLPHLDPEQPAPRVIRSQGTYLAWMDLRGLGLDQGQLVRWAEDQAHLWLSDGVGYGPEGRGFMRANLAHPRSVIGQAAQNLTSAAGAL